jgi:hypothetical protein
MRMVLSHAYSSYILYRRKNCLCQLLHVRVHAAKDTRQIEVLSYYELRLVLLN